jgi:hypothetical protein
MKDEFGQRIARYNNLEIVPMEAADGSDSILAFAEAASSGSATAASMYIVSMGPGRLMGIEVPGGIQSTRLGNAEGQLETRPGRGFRVEWYPGLALYHGRAVTRIRHIGNLAFVK